MPSAIWTGSISFGLVQVPVRLVGATKSRDVSFNQLEEGTGARIRYKKVSDATGEEVPPERIKRGYEISKGEYVRMTDEDFQAARGEQHRGITIHDFVPAEQIDPIYFERTYFLGPEEGPGEAIYALLVEAMQRSPYDLVLSETEFGSVEGGRNVLAYARVNAGR